MYLPARGPVKDCLVLNPRKKGKAGEEIQNQSQRQEVTSSLTPISAPYLQTVSQAQIDRKQIRHFVLS